MQSGIFAVLLITLFSPNSGALTNSMDKAQAQFFIDQCPGCTPTSLQYLHNQQRMILSRTENSAITLKPGFYTIQSPEVPAKVKQASRAVFSLIILSDDESRFPESKTQELGQLQQKLFASPEPHKQRVAQVVKLYWEKCRQQNQRVCRAPINEGATGGGSAVLIGAAGKDLWTAGHVFEQPFRQALQKLQSDNVQDLVMRHQSFKVLIFNSENKLVAHPFNNSLHLAYSASDSVVPRLGPNIQQDTLRFELKNSLGQGLEIANQLREGANIYSVGYPACTGCAEKYNSMEERLVSGTRFPHRDATQFDHQITLGQILSQDNNLIITNADAHGGMSGGATLDEDGRVIGINSAVGVTVSSPHYLADRRLKLSRPTVWSTQLAWLPAR